MCPNKRYGALKLRRNYFLFMAKMNEGSRFYKFESQIDPETYSDCLRGLVVECPAWDLCVQTPVES